MAKADDLKSQQFISGLVKIPFKKYISLNKGKSSLSYLESIEKILNECVYGHIPAKKHITRIAANAYYHGKNSHQIIFGISGPKGNGKTTLIKNGLAKCFKDENNQHRPSFFIPLGGANQEVFKRP